MISERGEEIRKLLKNISARLKKRISLRLGKVSSAGDDGDIYPIRMSGPAMPEKMPERELLWLVPVKSHIADETGKEWSLTMVGRKREKVDKKGNRKEGLFAIESNDAPDLDKLDLDTPLWSQCYSAWNRFASRVEKPADGERISVSDVLGLEGLLNRMWVSGGYRRSDLRAIRLDDVANPLRRLESSRQVNIANASRKNCRARLPHVSHRGRLCPFHTPESKNIGLQLFLAAGASKGPGGRGIESGEDKSLFSLAVGMVPYPHHSDGPRLMMGGKNLKQAESGIAEGEPPLVPGYVEGERAEHLDVLKGHVDGNGRFKPYLGANALVAVMPWQGHTYEDGLVISRDFAKKLEIKEGEEKLSFTLPLKAKAKDEIRDFKETLADLNGSYAGEIREEGREYVYGGSLPVPPILRTILEEGVRYPRYSLHVPGRIENLSVEIIDDRARSDVPRSAVRLTYTFLVDRPLRIGDKVTGRNGNKGVITQILDSPPVAHIGGREYPVDLIISPCSIIGRKNLGQIVEMVHGLAIRAKKDGLIRKEVREDGLYEGGAWRGELLPVLKELGMDEKGFPVTYDDPGGASEKREVRAFVGYQYIVRLYHHVDRKLQARGVSGPRNRFLGQPSSGGPRAGQRLGEMENWAILSRSGDALRLLCDLRKSGDGEDGTWSAAKNFLGLCGVDMISNENGLATKLSSGSALSARLAEKALREVDDVGTAREKRNEAREEKDNPAESEAPSPAEDDESALLNGAREDFHVISFTDQKKSGKTIELMDSLETVLSGMLEEEGASSLFGNDSGLAGILKESLGDDAEKHPLYAILKKIKSGKREDKEEDKDKRHGQYPLDGLALFICRDSDGRWGIPFCYSALKKLPHLARLYRAVLGELSAFVTSKGSARYRLKKVLVGLSELRRTLLVFLKGKRGLFRGHMLGHRIDHSGRAVIVNEPSLPLDEVKLPVRMALDLLRRHSALKKLDITERRLEELADMAHSSDGQDVKNAVDEINLKLWGLEKGLWCILIRQPSLHRHSVQAFKFSVWEHMAIAMPPMITPGFNADFDGDTMAVYLPPEPWCFDLSSMSIGSGPGQIGDGHPLLATDLDLALGWQALEENARAKWRREAAIDGRDTDDNLGSVVKGILKSHRNDWCERIHELQEDICAASTGSCSLSPLELERLYRENVEKNFTSEDPEKETEPLKLKEKLTAEYGDMESQWQSDDDEAKGEERREETWNAQRKEFKDLEGEVEKNIKKWLEDNRQTHLARLVLGKAKGKPSDLRQMTAFLGLQDCYSRTEKKPLADSWIRGCFWNGLSEDDLFRYSYASRQAMADKKLATAEAGYLSRQLAEGLYDTVVVQVDGKDDCGSSDGLALYLNGDGRIELNILKDDKKQLRRNVIFPGSPEDAIVSIAWGRVPVDSANPLTKEACLKLLKDAASGGDGPFVKLRSPLTCRCGDRGICAKCAGSDLGRFPLDDPRLHETDMPVGLISAMAIGERGTQLAMKRFHQVGAARKEDSISVLRHLFISAGRNGKKMPLEDRFEALVDLLSNDEKHLERYGELPQALIHFELALKAGDGLMALASNSEGRWLEAMSFQEIEADLWKPGTETIKGLKARVLLNERREEGKNGQN